MSVPTIAQLRYILAVHRYGHFGAAARACGVAQPTLSAQIKRAEEALGITVFVRRTKPVSLTDKGRLLVEQVHAVVVPRDATLTEDELIEFCRDHLGGYKLPRSVAFQTEELPKSGPGKVLKRELRRPYWEGRDRDIN